MSRFQTAAALTAVALVAYSFGAGRTPEPQAEAAPVVVGSPPGVESQLRSELADARELVAVLQKELAAATAPKSTCAGGLCETCQCPGDGRCAAGECKPVAVQSAPVTYTQAANCAGGNCATYQPTRRFRIFGRRR